MERCEDCGQLMVDDPDVPGGLLCPGCDMVDGDVYGETL